MAGRAYLREVFLPSPDVMAERYRRIVRIHDDPAPLVRRIARRVREFSVMLDDLAHVGALPDDVDQG